MDANINALRLLKTPLPRPDESLMGYILRLTEENGYDSPTWIFNQAELNISVADGGWKTLYHDRLKLCHLKRLTGLDHTEFEALRYKFIESTDLLAVSGSSLSSHHLRFASPKICPACIRQDKYYQRLWDLLSLTACPTHGTVLMDVCPGCGKAISWHRNRLSVCKCGLDWRDADQTEADPLSLKIARQVQKLCGSNSNKGQSYDEKNNPLYDLGLDDLCNALSLMACSYLHIKDVPGVKWVTNNSLWHEAYSYAYSIFMNWPENFYKFLDRERQQHQNAEYGYDLRRRINKLCDEKALYFIMVAFEGYCDFYWENTNDQSVRLLSVNKRFVSQREACQDLHIETKWLDVLIERGKVGAFGRSPGSKYTLVDWQSCARYRAKLKDLINTPLAAEILDIDSAIVHDLVREGCLTPLSGPTIDGFAEWRFDYREIVNLIERIRAKLTGKRSTAQGILMSFGRIIKYLEKKKLSIGHFVRSVLEGKIIPQKELPHKGLSCFAFSKKQVNNYVGEYQGPRPEVVKSIKCQAEMLVRRTELSNMIYTKSSSLLSSLWDEDLFELGDIVNVAKQLFIF